MKRVNDATDNSVGNLKHRFQGLDLAPLPAFTSHIHRGYFPYGHDAFNRELETDEKPLEDNDIVLIDGKQYQAEVFSADHSDCVNFNLIDRISFVCISISLA